MKLHPLKRKEVIRKLKKLGFQYRRASKRHYEIWYNPKTCKKLPIPNYNEFGVGLVDEICEEIGVKPTEFMEI